MIYLEALYNLLCNCECRGSVAAQASGLLGDPAPRADSMSERSLRRGVAGSCSSTGDYVTFGRFTQRVI